MVKKRHYKRPRRPASRPLAVSPALSRLLAAMGGTPGRARLSSLWEHWQEALGEELGAMAQPLGCHNDVLLLGARDGLEIMELGLQSPEILARVNAFLQCEYFGKTRVSLVGGRQTRARDASGTTESTQPRREPVKSSSAGIYLAEMDMQSPVARCYARFAQKNQKGGGNR